MREGQLDKKEVEGMMDEDILDKKGEVSAPECLEQKFPISKKEVSMSNQMIIGGEFLGFQQVS